MRASHHVVFLSGLGNSEQKITFFINSWNWKKYGFIPIIPPMRWHDTSESTFESKLKRLIPFIDHVKKNGNTVSIVGVSAGGSAAINMFTTRSKEIRKVINVCGRLRRGPLSGFRSFTAKTASSPSFAESILLCERNEHLLSVREKTRILTVRSKFGDELVPSSTTTIQGVRNIQVPMVEHGLSIAMALTFFSKPLMEFLLEE